MKKSALAALGRVAASPRRCVASSFAATALSTLTTHIHSHTQAHVSASHICVVQTASSRIALEIVSGFWRREITSFQTFQTRQPLRALQFLCGPRRPHVNSSLRLSLRFPHSLLFPFASSSL